MFVLFASVNQAQAVESWNIHYVPVGDSLNLPQVIGECEASFSLYKTYQTQVVPRATSLNKDDLISDLQEFGRITSDQERQLNEAFETAAILNLPWFWGKVSDTLFSMGLKTKDATQAFVSAFQAGEIPEVEINSFLNSLSRKLTEEFPSPNMGNVLEVQNWQKSNGIAKLRFAKIRSVLQSDQPNRNEKLQFGIVALFLSQGPQASKNLNAENSFWKKWSRQRADKIINLGSSRNLEVSSDLVRAMTASTNKRTALEAVKDFVIRSQSISDLDYYYIVNKIPLGVNWGELDSRSELDQAVNLTRLGSQQWDSYFSPTDRRVLYLSLMKVGHISDAKRFEASLPGLLKAVERTFEFHNKVISFKQGIMQEFVRKHSEVLHANQNGNLSLPR